MNNTAPQKVLAVTTKLDWLTPDLCYAEFSLPEEIQFFPGQFMNIAVGGGVRRSYSLANPPSQNKIAATYMDTIAGGPGSKFFAALQVEQVVDIFLPFGKFIYSPGNNDVYLLATGTGITPFVSMLLHELEAVQSGRQIHLLYGVRSQDRIAVGELLQRLAQAHSNFSYEIFVSQPLPGWEGKTGRITSAVKQLEVSPDAQFYVCGSGDMITEMKLLLAEKGVEEGQIFHEKFY